MNKLFSLVIGIIMIIAGFLGAVILVYSVITMYILGMIVGIALMIISAILESRTARDIAKDLKSSTIPETKRNTVACRGIVREILGISCDRSGATMEERDD
jgi:arginine exporter protein ArgO